MAGPVIAAVVGILILLNALAYGWLAVLKKINVSGGEAYVVFLIAVTGFIMIIWAIELLNNRNKNEEEKGKQNAQCSKK